MKRSFVGWRLTIDKVLYVQMVMGSRIGDDYRFKDIVVVLLLFSFVFSKVLCKVLIVSRL